MKKRIIFTSWQQSSDEHRCGRIEYGTVIRMIANPVSIERNYRIDIQRVRFLDHLRSNGLRIPDNMRIV